MATAGVLLGVALAAGGCDRSAQPATSAPDVLTSPDVPCGGAPAPRREQVLVVVSPEWAPACFLALDRAELDCVDQHQFEYQGSLPGVGRDGRSSLRWSLRTLGRIASNECLIEAESPDGRIGIETYPGPGGQLGFAFIEPSTKHTIARVELPRPTIWFRPETIHPMGSPYYAWSRGGRYVGIRREWQYLDGMLDQEGLFDVRRRRLRPDLEASFALRFPYTGRFWPVELRIAPGPLGPEERWIPVERPSRDAGMPDRLALMDSDTGREICVFPVSGTVVAWRSDGALVALRTGAGIEVFDVPGAAPRFTIPGATDATFRPGGDTLAAARDDGVWLHDARDGRALRRVGTPPTGSALQASADGAFLYARYRDSGFRVHRVADAVSITIRVVPGAAIAFTDDGLVDGDVPDSQWVRLEIDGHPRTFDEVRGRLRRPGLVADFFAGRPIAPSGLDPAPPPNVDERDYWYGRNRDAGP